MPSATTTDARRERQPAPPLFVTSGKSYHSFPALTHFKGCPSRDIMKANAQRSTSGAVSNDFHRRDSRDATNDPDTNPPKKRRRSYHSPRKPVQNARDLTTHAGPEPERRSQEARRPGSRRPHTNITDTTTTIRKPLYGAAVLKTAPGLKHQPSLHLKPPMASSKARRVADSRRFRPCEKRRYRVRVTGMTDSWPCNDRRLMHLDGASSILLIFPTCGKFVSCWTIRLMLHPRFRYRVYGQEGCSRLSSSVAPGGNPDVSCSVGDRPFMGLQLRARVWEHLMNTWSRKPRLGGGGIECTWRFDGGDW